MVFREKIIAKYCMSRILPCQTENKAMGRAEQVATIIDFDCNFMRAGTVCTGPGKD